MKHFFLKCNIYFSDASTNVLFGKSIVSLLSSQDEECKSFIEALKMENSPYTFAKVILMASMWGLHQDTDFWRQDAAKFKPERWHQIKTRWTFVPFLGGPCTCPAQQIVLTQNAYVLARFGRAFKRIENMDPNPWTFRVHIV